LAIDIENLKAYRKKYYEEHKEQMLKVMKEQYRQKRPLPPYRTVQEGYKLCCKCKETKPATIEYFGVSKKNKRRF